MGKKDRCAVFACNNDHNVFSRNIWWKTIPVSSEVRFCSCKDPRHLATWTRLLSRKGFKVNKNAKVCSNHFKFDGRPVDSQRYPTLFQKGCNREIVITRKRKAPIGRLPVKPIRSEKKKSDTDSIQREIKRNNTVDTPKRLLWSFTVLFIGKKAIIITSKQGHNPNNCLSFAEHVVVVDREPRRAWIGWLVITRPGRDSHLKIAFKIHFFLS